MMRIATIMVFSAVGHLLAANSADAGFQVTFGAGGSTTTIADGGVGDSDAASGRIGVGSVTVGGYTFTFTLAKTNTPGTDTLAFVNSSTSEISGKGPTDIIIYASADGFTSPSSPPDMRVLGGSTFQFLEGTGSNDSATHSIRVFYDTSNAVSTSGSGTLVGSASASGISTNSSLNTSEDHAFNTTPYALNLELKAKITGSGDKVVDLDGSLDVVPTPEPASLTLFSLGLAGLFGYGVRRRRRPDTQQAS